MTDTVVPIRPLGTPPGPPSPDRRVVSLCEDLLAQALSGRVRTVAVAMLCVGEGETGLRPLLTWVDEPSLAMALSGAAAKMARDIAER